MNHLLGGLFEDDETDEIWEEVELDEGKSDFITPPEEDLEDD